MYKRYGDGRKCLNITILGTSSKKRKRYSVRRKERRRIRGKAVKKGFF